MTINISKDYTETPGARYRSEGDFSGEDFREKILIPTFKKVINTQDKLKIILDGGYGYPTSFLEEAFGGLARIYPPETVNSKLLFITEDEPSLDQEIRNYILHANDKRKV